MTTEEKIGIKINKLTIIEKDTSGTRRDMWIAQCDCGGTRTVRWYEFIRGKYKDCGNCSSKTNQFVDVTGQKFGKLHVNKYLGNQMWECTCECGNTIQVRSWDLRYKKTSCGKCNEYKHIDIIGKTFGEWTVNEYVGNSRFKCTCSCGNTGIVLYTHLVNGNSKSCGHTKLVDITGNVYGDLTVISRGTGNDEWVCKCSCGNTVIVKGNNLKNGKSKSCGCKREYNFKNTMLDKYGVESYAKIGRDEVQLYALESEDNFKEFISKAFDKKPSTFELADKLGINAANTAKYIHKFNADDMVTMGSDTWHSKYEEEIAQLFDNCIKGDRKILKGQEIDIYVPELKLGIEFNGSYYHSEKFLDANYHLDKTLKAEKSGVRLIHIFEYEWTNEQTKEKLIELIRNIANTNKNVIYARNCEVKEIDTDTAKAFISKYHLQGYTGSDIKIGIYYNNELLGVQTFGTPRFSTEAEYELIRLCWKNGVHVIGGSERLFNYFISKYNPKSVISYCNIAKFSGYVYNKLGFKCLGITRPSYMWFNKSSGEVVSRYQAQKSKLLKIGLGTSEQTETEIMHSAGYYKIYDCGNRKYIWRDVR